MLIGTHNSLSGYKGKQWYLTSFEFLSKCQSKDLESLFKNGCRSFDLRFVKHKDEWYGAHGILIYDITLHEVLNIMFRLSLEDKIRFRVLHEDALIKNPGDYKELVNIIKPYISPNLELLYINSKKTGETYLTGKFIDDYKFYEGNVVTENDRDSLCERVSFMYELETTDHKTNCIGCYESGGIPIEIFGWLPKVFNYPLQVPFPKLAAEALTRIALKKKWKSNDLIIVDFL